MILPTCIIVVSFFLIRNNEDQIQFDEPIDERFNCCYGFGTWFFTLLKFYSVLLALLLSAAPASAADIERKVEGLCKQNPDACLFISVFSGVKYYCLAVKDNAMSIENLNQLLAELSKDVPQELKATYQAVAKPVQNTCSKEYGVTIDLPMPL